MAESLLNLHVANTLPSDIPELLLTKTNHPSWLPRTQTCSPLGLSSPAPTGWLCSLSGTLPGMVVISLPPPSSVSCPGLLKSCFYLFAQPLATGTFIDRPKTNWEQGPAGSVNTDQSIRTTPLQKSHGQAQSQGREAQWSSHEGVVLGRWMILLKSSKQLSFPTLLT